MILRGWKPDNPRFLARWERHGRKTSTALNGLTVTDPYQAGFPLLDPSLDDLAELQVVTGSKPAASQGSGTDIVLATLNRLKPGMAVHDFSTPAAPCRATTTMPG